MRLILPLLIAAVVTVTIWYFVKGVKPPIDVAIKGADLGLDDTMALSSIRLVEKKNNINRIELFAQNASIGPDGESADLKNFALHSRIDKERRLVVVAQQGFVNTRTFDVRASGGTLVHDESGNALLTENLQMDNENQTVTTNGEVRIYGKNFVLKGKGLFVDLTRERLEVLSSVTAVFKSGGGPE